MKKQVLVIGGGTSFDTYDDYIDYLKNKEIDLDRLKPRTDWKSTLADKLGGDYEVFLPSMPNKRNAKYKEWKIWFERILPLLNNEVILIGHSLGAAFLAKYLSLNKISTSIRATILVSAPMKMEQKGETLIQFSPPQNLKKLSEQCKKIYLIHSKDDQIVKFEHLEKYKKALPDAELIIFKDRGHFLQENFPEIVELVRNNMAKH